MTKKILKYEQEIALKIAYNKTFTDSKHNIGAEWSLYQITDTKENGDVITAYCCVYQVKTTDTNEILMCYDTNRDIIITKNMENTNIAKIALPIMQQMFNPKKKYEVETSEEIKEFIKKKYTNHKLLDKDNSTYKTFKDLDEIDEKYKKEKEKLIKKENEKRMKQNDKLIDEIMGA